MESAKTKQEQDSAISEQLNPYSVCGVCYKYQNLKKYILWSLRLFEDMPTIFNSVKFLQPHEVSKNPPFNIYLVDDIEAHSKNMKDDTTSTVMHLKNMVTGDEKTQRMSELELLAKSGFLSVVGLTQFTVGILKDPYALPQQPTNDLLFYYVHSLMSVTKVLLAIHNIRSSAAVSSQPRVIENVAVDNLLFLCQGVLRLKELGLWNNDQGSNWLDGGAPFYSIYKSKDGVFFTVACIEQKFYKNFLQTLKENKLDESNYQYLLGNMLNQDEWPDMKTTVQQYFSKRKANAIDVIFDGKDCCVQRVLSQQQALDSDYLKGIVVKGRKARKLSSHVWQSLVEEAELRRNLILTPPAKL